MPPVPQYATLLKTHRSDPADHRLTRIIPFLSYRDSAEPGFLYTSGRRNRCNPAGVDCIYFSEDRDTAQAEYDAGCEDHDAPALTYHARLNAAHIIDLARSAQQRKFRVPASDFTANFRLQDLDLQRLGEAIAIQQRVVAIRYPSRAMQDLGKSGFNLAIFPSAIAAPDFLVIYGQHRKVLERWPKN